MKYVNCKKYAQEILDEVKAVPNKGKLVIITVGDDNASKVYVKGKMKDCEYCGIPVEHIKIEDSPLAGIELKKTILKNNYDDEVAGIIVQLPLPNGMDAEKYCRLVVPHKDVDGLCSDSLFEPCTPKGIVHLMKQELGDLTGLDVLIIGRSKLVGKPLARMLTDEDCTVTLAHSKTNCLYGHIQRADVVISAVGKAKKFDLSSCWNSDLAEVTRRADILVSAIGKARFITPEMVKPGAVVIDVGINRDENNKLCGDFKMTKKGYFDWIKVTPVPNGVGLLTRAMLMKNVAEASQERE